MIGNPNEMPESRFRLDPLARKEKRRNRGGSGVELVAGARNHLDLLLSAEMSVIPRQWGLTPPV
jgi:hypothetical protein